MGWNGSGMNTHERRALPPYGTCKVGVFMGVELYSPAKSRRAEPMAFLRPQGGGKEWTTRPVNVEPVTEGGLPDAQQPHAA
jgi:hypothetical protein